jgi:hypothetical protein
MDKYQDFPIDPSTEGSFFETLSPPLLSNQYKTLDRRLV